MAKGGEKTFLASVMQLTRIQGVKPRILKITTGIAAVYHLLLGSALLLLPAENLSGITRFFLGTELDFDPTLTLIGKFVSAYLLAFGVMLTLLWVNPVRHRALVIPALVLFGIRLAGKLVFWATIEETFGISRNRSLFAFASLAVIFGLMVWAKPKGENSGVL